MSEIASQKISVPDERSRRNKDIFLRTLGIDPEVADMNTLCAFPSDRGVLVEWKSRMFVTVDDFNLALTQLKK